MPVKDTLSSLGKIVHREWDEVVDRLGWGNDKPVSVANYIGFGREDYLNLTGRVLRDKGIRRDERDNLLDNIVNNFKRFNSREIRGAEVEITWGGHNFKRTTDSEGYFHVEHHCPPDGHVHGNHELWQEAEIKVLTIPGEDIRDVTVHEVKHQIGDRERHQHAPESGHTREIVRLQAEKRDAVILHPL